MSVFVPFPYGVQAVIRFQLDTEIITNRLWFWTDALDLPTAVELQGLANGVFDWYADLILPNLSSDIILATVVTFNWYAPDLVGEAAARSPVAGGVAESSHSANVAVVVKFRWPNQYNRRKQNKNYVAGVPLSGIDLNTPTLSTEEFLFEGYAALIDAARTFAPGNYWYWVVTSAFEGGAPRSEMAFGLSIGVEPPGKFKVGQRRKRLPAS